MWILIPFYYYSKVDPNKEPIDKIAAHDHEGAVIYFAGRKGMDIDTFIELYETKQYVHEQPK